MEQLLELECPHCARRSQVPLGFAGQRGRCPGCKQVIEVPTLEEVQLALKARPAGTSDPGPDPAGADGAKVPLTLVAESSTSARRRAMEREEARAGLRPCAFCGEPIQALARKCRYCGEFLDAELARRMRLRTRQSDWALPFAARALLAAQALILGVCAPVAAFEGAEQPTLGGGGLLLVGALAFLGLSSRSEAEGCRSTLRLLAAGNGLGILGAVVAINGLQISPGPPSPILGGLGAALAIASAALALLAQRRVAARGAAAQAEA